MKTYGLIEIIVSFWCGFLAYYLGGYDVALKTMFALTVLDFITGVLVAVYKKRFRCSKCANGILKKIFIYFTVAISVIIQRFTGGAIPIRETVIVFYIVSEGMSALENIGKVSNYPQRLKQIFESLQKEYEDKNE